MKLPKYVDDIIDHIARCEERAIGTPRADAHARVRKELIDESLTAKNPVPKAEENPKWPKEELISFQYPKAVKLFKQGKKHKEVAAACPRLNEIHLDRAYQEATGRVIVRLDRVNPWPKDNKIPADFKPNFKKWLDWRGENTFCLNTKAKFEGHPDIEEDICVMDGKMSFIYPFTCQGPRGCPDTDHDWIHLSVEKNVLDHADDEKKVIKDPYGGGELVISNWRAIMRELIEKGMAQEGYLAKSNPRRSDGMKPSDFDQEQLYIGTQVEREHTDDVREAQRIAMDHLAEDADYYKKLKACVEPELPDETWVDDEEDQMEKSNPSRPTVSELSKVFRSTIKDPFTGMSIRGFDESSLGRNLSPEERDEVWRDIQLFIQKMVDQMLEKVLRLKSGSLQFKKVPESTRGETWESIEENRYYKLFLTSYLMSLLLRFFYVSEAGTKKVFEVLEGKSASGKDGWRKLAQYGNREAHAESVYIGMLALMNKVSSANLALWLEEHPDHIAKIYEDAEARWKKTLSARLSGNKKTKSEIAALKPTSSEGIKASRDDVAKEKATTPKEKGEAAVREKLKDYRKEEPESVADSIVKAAEKRKKP